MMSSPAADDRTLQDVLRVTSTHRFTENVLPTFLVWLYMPIGLCLCVVRVFILLHVYVISVVLCRLPALRRFVCRTISIILGFVPIEVPAQPEADSGSQGDGDTQRQLVVSNHVSPFDFVAVESLLRVRGNGNSNLLTVDHGMFHWFGTCIPHERQASEHRPKWKDSNVLFTVPEKAATNGNYGVLKFDETAFSCLAADDPSHACSVQPVAIQAWRPFPFDSIALHVHGASRWADLFWLLALPFTLVRVAVLRPFVFRVDTASLAASRSAEAIATALQLQQLQITHADLHLAFKKHVLRSQASKQSAAPAQQTRSSSVLPTGRQTEFDEVKSILPHVRDDRIWSALERSGSAELAIATLLEEPCSTSQSPQQDATSSSKSKPTSTSAVHTEQEQAHSAEQASKNARNKFVFGDSRFGRKPQDRQMSFEQRKRALIDAARSKFLEKHTNVTL